MTNHLQFKINTTTILESIQEFLDAFPPKFQLSFFDFYYPQVSDPGAYVTVQKLNPGLFIFYLGNHGWQSKPKEITRQELAAYIFKNRDHTAHYFEFHPYSEKIRLRTKGRLALLLEKIAAYLK